MNILTSQDTFTAKYGTDGQYPLSPEEWERYAKECMDPGAFGYIQSGAGGEESMKANEKAFKRWQIKPRVLRDVSAVDTNVEIMGRTYSAPVFVAPVGVQKIAHDEGELASAKATASLQLPMIASTVSSYPLEEIASVLGTSPKWFQLYWSTNEKVSYSMIRRAEKAGYEAIVLTVDTVTLGWRETDLRNGYSPLKRGFASANYVQDPAFLESLPDREEETIIDYIEQNINHPALNWEDVKSIKQHTSLPLVIKGILHPEDAKLALKYGADAIIVSNHGGRQLDGCIGALDALPEVVEAVEGKIPVLFDSGIRRGIDVLKALALGAAAVLVGRPYIYGLAVDGESGVKRVLENLLQEFKLSLTLSGIASIKEVSSIEMVKQ
ncbi:isopentenyl diphosphate isomerase/L-lactate dehydrogenase-like FMN-dependent dehydrogenase [Bacillus fengqiuensis]|nr:isopentenyl diphosphate isomerase/L-lactate dehydrogenase-like FMN-dependent dehydrogenase [Bacillus fengqiuensis]